MEWVETTGRTIADALDAALDELGVDENDVEYEVIEEPKSGFFGRLGGSEARIRARVKPLSREKPGEHNRRRRGSSRPRHERQDGERAATAPTSSEAQAEPEARAATATSTSPTRRRRGGRGRGGRGSGGSATVSGAMASPAGPGGRGNEAAQHTERQGSTVDTNEQDVPIEVQAEAAEEFAQGLVDAFELGARAKSVIDGDALLVEITGENLGLLVGPRGTTLQAIEELVRTVVQRQTDGHGVRIHVDVGGYRAKRREALAKFTRQLAEKVLETGRPQALEPMSASDRKVVHDVAAEIDGVATESEGEDPRRRVVLRRA